MKYSVSLQISKYDIEESIKREMSGDLKDGMISIGKTFELKMMNTIASGIFKCNVLFAL